MPFHPQSKNDLYFRAALCKAYGDKCVYCTKPLIPGNMQVDHILATKARHSDCEDFCAYLTELETDGFDIAKPDYIENFFPTCPNCNRQKTNLHFDVKSLRYYHNIAREHTPKIISLINAYHQKRPENLNDFQPIYTTRYMTEVPAKPVILHRNGELNELRRLINEEGKRHILIHGFGGLGKTTLAQALFHELSEEYEDAAWIHYSQNFKNSAVASIEQESLEKSFNIDERWAYLKTLKNDARKKLIVIDNVEGEHDDAINALTGWPDTTVILTSRKDEIECYHSFNLNCLNEDACVDLFYHNYNGLKDDSSVQEMVCWAQYHTLTVRLLARGAKYETDLKSYSDKVLSLGLKASKHRIQNGSKKDTIAAHMKALFDIQNRSAEEQAVLQKLSLIPAGAYLSANEAEQWFGMELDPLDTLVDDGWVMLANGRYSLHPIVKEIILLDRLPADCADGFLSCAESDEFFVYAEIYTEIIRKIVIAEAVLKATKKGSTLQIAHILHNIGRAYDILAQYDAALRWYTEAREIKEAILGEKDTDTADTYSGIAVVYRKTGKFKEALEYLNKMLETYKDKRGSDHPDIATCYNNIALVYLENGKYNEAIDYLNKALDIYKRKLDPNDTNIANSYNNIALVYWKMGKLGEALEYNNKSLSIRKNKLGTDHPDTAQSYNNIALIYWEKGKLSEAQEYHKKALAIRKNKLGADHPDTAQSYHNLAHIYWKEDNLQTAWMYFEKALDIFLKKLGADHAYTKGTQKALDKLKKEMH